MTGTALATILTNRFYRAQNMGCDAIESDIMDGYDTTAHESSGFPLTYDDQIYFNLWVANTIHSLLSLQGDVMLVGLKNDINQAHDSQIYTAFDFVVSEQCFQYNECGYYSDFLTLNKPVFDAEYNVALSEFCPEAIASRISAIKKLISLNASREDCSAYYTEPPDADNDGVFDNLDNCINVTNADQVDTDSDGYGNACDADFNQNGVVDSTDLSDIKAALRTAVSDQDLNGNGVVDSTDYSIAKGYIRQPPGPSCCGISLP
jgi:hypothetical protein